MTGEMMPDNSPLLELREVSKSYAQPSAVRVLAGVNLRLDAGQSLAVVGVSGSGKSTLLNLIGALDQPTSGRVLIDGDDLAEMSEKELAGLRNRRIGFVFQMHHLLPQCTALENVVVPTLAAKAAGGSDVQDRALELLVRVGLGERANHYPGEMSGGECQRVAVARALINRPELLLADEPTGSLDRESSAGIADLLCDLARDEKLAMVIVTHSAEMARRMGKVMRLTGGALEEGLGE
jgi:ABC-type lipoprotein export system ATPase subunit